VKRLLLIIFGPGIGFILLMWIVSGLNELVYLVVSLSTILWAISIGIFALIKKLGTHKATLQKKVSSAPEDRAL
jgi:hypothetical protein